MDSLKLFEGKLLKDFSVYAPIVVNYYKDKKIYLYYKDSNIFSELKQVIDDLIGSFFSEVVLNSASVPVIITDNYGKNVTAHGNIPEQKMKDRAFVLKTLHSMASENNPIRVNLADTGVHFIFFRRLIPAETAQVFSLCTACCDQYFPVHCLPVIQLCPEI